MKDVLLLKDSTKNILRCQVRRNLGLAYTTEADSCDLLAVGFRRGFTLKFIELRATTNEMLIRVKRDEPAYAMCI